MNFAECIDRAIADGLVKPEKGQKAKDAYQAEFDSLIGTTSLRHADDMAAVKAVEKLTKNVGDAKWAKVNELRAAADISASLSASDNPARNLDLFFANLGFAYTRVVQQVQRKLSATMVKFGDRLRGAPVQELDDVIRSGHGETAANPNSKIFSDEILAAHEELRKLANMEGANYHGFPKQKVPFEHDRYQMRSRIFRGDVNGTNARQAWIRENLDMIDWDVTEWEGELIPEANREAFLDKRYSGIMSGGMSDLKPTNRTGTNIARNLSRNNFFYYKDAASWLFMQKKYGAGTIFEQLNRTLSSRARDIALLEHYGPNPTSMAEYQANIARKRAANIDEAKGFKDFRTMDATNKELNLLGEELAIFTNQVEKAVTPLAVTFATSRTLTAGAILSGAFIPNILGDSMNAHYAANLYHLPQTEVLTTLLKSFVKQASPSFRKDMLEAGFGLESAVNAATASTRYYGPMDGAYWARWLADKSFRATWLTPWTTGTKHGAAILTTSAFAKARGLTLDKVPFGKEMAAFGITPEEWDIFRATPVNETQKMSLLLPVDVLDRKGLDPFERQQLANKFHDFTLHIGSRVSLSSSIRTHAVLGGALDPNRAEGMVMSMVSLVKGFPALMYMVYLKDIMLAGGSASSKLMQVGKFFTMFTMAGALITQVKELYKGNEMLDMNPATAEGRTFWIKSVLNGGSLGYLGDIVLGTLGNFQHGGIADVLAGPQAELFDRSIKLLGKDSAEFFKVWMDKGPNEAVKQYKGGKDLVALVGRYNFIPWQMKLIFQRAIGDELFRQADPAGYARMLQQQKQRARSGQESWWPVGGKVRPPNPATVIGQ